MSRPYLTVREVAATLKVAPCTVRRRILAGELASVRVGRQWRVEATALDLTAPPAAPAECGATTSTAAALLAVSPRTVRRLAAAGHLPLQFKRRGYAAGPGQLRRWLIDQATGDD